MISFAKYSSSIIENGKRIIKAIWMGGSVITVKEVAPFGIDSQPPEGYTAIYANTPNKSEALILGYINTKQLAGVGEQHFYSVGANKEISAFIYLTNTGSININGSEYSAVRFEPLAQAIQTLDNSINTELLKIQTAITALGGTYINSPIISDISNAESETIKLK